MKPRTSKTQRRIAFTVIELMVMVLTVSMLLILLFSGLPRVSKEARSKHCVNNLKQIGISFRIFNQSDRYHMQIPSSQGGSMESITNGAVFHTFQVMSNEVNDLKLLVCPSDNRSAANDFSNLGNSNVSYFVGVDAIDTEPYLILSGDRNHYEWPADFSPSSHPRHE